MTPTLLAKLLDPRFAAVVAPFAVTCTLHLTDDLEAAAGALVISCTILLQLHRQKRAAAAAALQPPLDPTQEEQEAADAERIVQPAALLQTPDEPAALERLESLLPRLRELLDAGRLAELEARRLLAAVGPVWPRLGLAAEGQARATAVLRVAGVAAPAPSERLHG